MSYFDATVMEFMLDFPLTVNYVQSAVGEYDPALGAPAVTEQTIQLEAILLDLDLQSNGMSLKYGTQIMAGDKELYVRPPNKSDPTAQPLQVNPATDRVEVGGVVYKVVTFKELNPSGSDPVLYSFYLRR